MASPPIANLRTKYHSALSRASTTRSASSSGAPTASRMRSTSASKSSPACCRNYSGPAPRHDRSCRRARSRQGRCARVARRRAILDCRCARRHRARAGRDGRMVPIEQKDGTEHNRASKPGQITHSDPRRGIIIIVGVTFQNSAQMRIAEDNDVVQTLTPDRSDQPFGKAVLPRRGWCGRLVPDAHRAQSAFDNTAIDPVPIADEVVRSLIPRKRLGYLTCNPFRRRICCDVDPGEVSAVYPNDNECIEEAETDRRDDEQVHGGDLRRVVAQEGPPSLAGWPSSFDHVLGDA